MFKRHLSSIRDLIPSRAVLSHLRAGLAGLRAEIVSASAGGIRLSQKDDDNRITASAITAHGRARLLISRRLIDACAAGDFRFCSRAFKPVENR
jgi:hypothetical protein